MTTLRRNNTQNVGNVMVALLEIIGYLRKVVF